MPEFIIDLTDDELAALYALLRGRVLAAVSGLDRARPEDRILAKILAASGYQPKVDS